jgi:hypothetical protein
MTSTTPDVRTTAEIPRAPAANATESWSDIARDAWHGFTQGVANGVIKEYDLVAKGVNAVTPFHLPQVDIIRDPAVEHSAVGKTAETVGEAVGKFIANPITPVPEVASGPGTFTLKPGGGYLINQMTDLAKAQGIDTSDPMKVRAFMKDVAYANPEAFGADTAQGKAMWNDYAAGRSNLLPEVVNSLKVDGKTEYKLPSNTEHIVTSAVSKVSEAIHKADEAIAGHGSFTLNASGGFLINQMTKLAADHGVDTRDPNNVLTFMKEVALANPKEFGADTDAGKAAWDNYVKSKGNWTYLPPALNNLVLDGKTTYKLP